MTLKKREVVLLIEKAVESQSRFIESQKGDNNPQVRQLVEVAKGRMGAYRDVLEALCGNAIPLRIEAGM